MSITRFSALDILSTRSNLDLNIPELPSQNIASFFGENVFDEKVMKEYMPEKEFLNIMATIQGRAKLTHEVAEVVADAMKRWAMERGATHYAHWFQPWTGKTAEKHDSFFNLTPDGTVVEEFGASALVQQEPDGSSFPKGGLRSTFEARGYTGWDPTSPAFLIETADGITLCIPTIFITYNGDAQDFKLPLLRSIAFLENAALPVCQWFEKDVTRVYTTLGWEQEYFLIDEAFYNARPDLVMTGRTLLGKYSAKNQQLEDHYFGSIPERVYAYMRDFETECHKLAIPLRTRHNEVAPGQYEVAPVFEECNVAVDHNTLLMDVMERVARRHKLKVLLHEKPFAGINGSGKHNNWSMSTNTGKNLLSPGKEPAKNLRFLTFFVNTIMSVYEHADLLRASIATASNDHRLGANEAPPAIVSVFIGQEMYNLLNHIEKGKSAKNDIKQVLDLLGNLPDLEQDNTDRNRTSPFAFTGNKFEIRMVGSTANCAQPMTTLNTMMGDQLLKFYTEVEKMASRGKDRDEAILVVIRNYIKKCKSIIFEGDGYSDEWKEEATTVRGFNNSTTTPTALDAYIDEKSVKLFTSTGVMNARELHAFHDVLLESYSLKIDIESKMLEELCFNYVLPGAVQFQTQLAENINLLNKAGLDNVTTYQTETTRKVGKLIEKIYETVEKMKENREKAHHAGNTRSNAIAFCDTVKPLMEDIRDYADDLEHLSDDKSWSLVKYREMLFLR
ncbi:MAG: glutamine synthetase III [Saprospiraceae bacterium]